MTALVRTAAFVFAAAVLVAPESASAVAEFFGYQCCYAMSAVSMLPTLASGERIAVEKYAAGKLPEAGDLIVFHLPRDTSVVWVKRVIGIPGNDVQMINGVLYLNGVAVKQERMGDYTGPAGGKTNSAKRWRETLPNGISYETLDILDRGLLDNTPVYRVPAGNYFVLGDNRDNSTDSRVPPEQEGVGFVPLENIVGKVFRPWKSSSPAGAEKVKLQSILSEANLQFNKAA